jgi:uncharacterized protein (DUF4213/DUF364 family)
MLSLHQELIQTLIPGKILAVQVGLSRTAVLAETDDGIRCGMTASLSNPDLEHHIRPSVRNAGHLHELSALELASLVESESFTEVAIGYATINALLPRQPEAWVDLNAEDYLAQYGAGKNVAVVGHFPFTNRLRSLAKSLWVLELNPREGDLPAQAAPEFIPQADLIAITATTLINRTFKGLIDLCRPGTPVVLLGPSTPLSPIMFQHGIQILSGTIVTEPQATMLCISQGSSLRQLRDAGVVRLVTMYQPGKKDPHLFESTEFD